MSRRRYPRDLSDAEWALLAPLLPVAKAGGRPRRVDRREIVNAISSWLRGGVAWRAFPHDFPPGKTVYPSWRAGRLSGEWERIQALVRERLRGRAGRATPPRAGMVESQRVKTTEQGDRPPHPGMTAAPR
jgi:transposase